jgi:hypothetical protein
MDGASMAMNTPDLIRAYQERECLTSDTKEEPADGEVFAALATLGIIALVFFYFLIGGGLGR